MSIIYVYGRHLIILVSLNSSMPLQQWERKSKWKRTDSIVALYRGRYKNTKLCIEIKNKISAIKHAFALFLQICVDYCTSLFTCLKQKSLHKLQMVQNSAARILTGNRRQYGITPVLALLHCFPVRFKINLIDYILKSLAPTYVFGLLIKSPP